MLDQIARRKRKEERQEKAHAGRFSVFFASTAASGKAHEGLTLLKKVFCMLCLSVIIGGIVWGSAVVLEFARNMERTPQLSEDGYYEIRTAEDYRWFWEMTASVQSDLKGRLMRDITLNDRKDRENWQQMPPENHSIEVGGFTGIFDGNGYTIYGLYSENGYGLVRENFGTIQNVSIKDSLISGEYFAGGICYRNHQIIRNCRILGEFYHNEDQPGRMAGVSIVNCGRIEKCTYDGIMNGRKYDTDRAGICAENRGKVVDCSNLASQDAGEMLYDFFHAYAIADAGMENCYVGKRAGWFVPEDSHVFRISEDQFYMLSWLMDRDCYPFIAKEYLPGDRKQQSEDVYTACEDAFVFDMVCQFLENGAAIISEIEVRTEEGEETEECAFAVNLTVKGQTVEIKAYSAEGIGEDYEKLVEYTGRILGEAGEDSWEHRTYQLTQLPESRGSRLYWIAEERPPEMLMLYQTKWETGFWYRKEEILYRITLPEKELSKGAAVWEELKAAAGNGKVLESGTKNLLWYKILNHLCAERELSEGILWKDEKVREAVYKELSENDQAKDRIFSREEILGLKELLIEDVGDVVSYQDLQYLPELTCLELCGGVTRSWMPYSAISRLKLEKCYINPKCISNFSDLSELEIVDCSDYDDFSFLEDLPYLKMLSVENSASRRDREDLISAVSTCRNLEKLSLRSDELSDIEKLGSLTNLQELDLSFNKIEDFSPLYALRRLRKLSVNDNPGKELGKLIYLSDLSIGSRAKWEEDLKEAQQVLDQWYPDNCFSAEGESYHNIEAEDLARGDFNGDGIEDLAIIGRETETFDWEWNLISPMQRKVYLFQGIKDGFEEVQTISLPSPIWSKTGDWEEGPVSYIAMSGNHLLVQTVVASDGVSGGWSSISVYTWTEGRMEPECRHETDYKEKED